jgi:hypothetical protein
MKGTRIFFNTKHYKLRAMMNTEKMVKAIEKIHRDYEKIGNPIPEEGLKTSLNYNHWETISIEKGADPIFPLQDILLSFNIDPKTNAELISGLIWTVYLKLPTAPMDITHLYFMEVSKDKKFIEIKIQIFPYTIKNDVVEDDKMWSEIWHFKNHVWKKNTKNKIWETFDRDLELYKLYQKWKKDDLKSFFSKVPDSVEYKEILKKYYRLEDSEDQSHSEKSKDQLRSENLEDQLRNIISRCRKSFGKMNLL